MSNRTTWRKLVAKEMAKFGDSWSDCVVRADGDEALLDRVFDSVTYGCNDESSEMAKDLTFLAWGKTMVYAPVLGEEAYTELAWVMSTPRNPPPEKPSA